MKFSNCLAAAAAVLSLVLLLLHLGQEKQIQELSSAVQPSTHVPTGDRGERIAGLDREIERSEAELASVTEHLGEMRSRVDELRKSMGLLSRLPKNPWQPIQATGPPSVERGLEGGGAWCPANANSAEEWLLVTFENEAEVAEVKVHENFNPGSLIRAAAVVADADGETREHLLWTRKPTGTVGSYVQTIAPTESGGSPIRTRRIKLYLSPESVPGWNEIDAVQLVGTDGSEQWALEAAASSHWSKPP